MQRYRNILCYANGAADPQPGLTEAIKLTGRNGYQPLEVSTAASVLRRIECSLLTLKPRDFQAPLRL